MKIPRTDPILSFFKRVTKWDERDPEYTYFWDKKKGWYLGRTTYGLSFRGIVKYIFLKSNREERLHAWGILISTVSLIISLIALFNTL